MLLVKYTFTYENNYRDRLLFCDCLFIKRLQKARRKEDTAMKMKILKKSASKITRGGAGPIQEYTDPGKYG